MGLTHPLSAASTAMCARGAPTSRMSWLSLLVESEGSITSGEGNSGRPNSSIAVLKGRVQNDARVRRRMVRFHEYGIGREHWVRTATSTARDSRISALPRTRHRPSENAGSRYGSEGPPTGQTHPITTAVGARRPGAGRAGSNTSVPVSVTRPVKAPPPGGLSAGH